MKWIEVGGTRVECEKPVTVTWRIGDREYQTELRVIGLVLDARLRGYAPRPFEQLPPWTIDIRLEGDGPICVRRASEDKKGTR